MAAGRSPTLDGMAKETGVDFPYRLDSDGRGISIFSRVHQWVLARISSFSLSNILLIVLKCIEVEMLALQETILPNLTLKT